MNILRQIVAGPRAPHQETGLDLCYVTDNIIVTSGPSGTYPKSAYRNPLKELVKFLDEKHGAQWKIFEFRAEGTGYPDSEVYGRIAHFPWPDHHPPPFAIVPLIVASMRNWLKDDAATGRVAVVHCKAGKGRSGTATCSYLVSEEGWTAEQAMQRFTERRMRPGFGSGISIPSQLRTVSYLDRWTKHGKKYLERKAQVLEIHIWGLRNGVKVAVEGFEQEGKVIKTFHTFSPSERTVVNGQIMESGLTDAVRDVFGKTRAQDDQSQSTSSSDVGDVVFKTIEPITVPTSDINIDFERRNTTKLGGFALVTAVAHCWFNIFFEGNGPEQDGRADDSGVFKIDWEALDGIKGSSQKGTRAFDKLAVLWRAAPASEVLDIAEPAPGEPVGDLQAADWRAGNDDSEDFEKQLGLRESNAESAAISRANSLQGDGSPHEDIRKQSDDAQNEGTRSDVAKT